jgi:hypothetical protein
MEAIFVDEDNPYFNSEDGVLFNKSMTKLIRCPDAKPGSYVVPETVTEIGERAFQYCTLLHSVTLPNGILTLGTYAFSACTFPELILPDSLSELGPFALSSTSLRTISIPSSVKRLSSGAFRSCSQLETVHLPEGLDVISSSVFRDCTRLKGIEIPASVTTIGAFAFEGCDLLEYIIFRGSAPDLVNEVFEETAQYVSLYRPHSASGYENEDWTALEVIDFDGPVPRTGFTRWLAKNEMITTTPCSQIMTGVNLPFLVVYAFNLDASEELKGKLPTITKTDTHLNYRYYAIREGITYDVRASSDLSSWDQIPVSLGPLDLEGYRVATVEATERPPVFMRTEISLEE